MRGGGRPSAAASIATPNRYLHFLGTGADAAGLEKLNSQPGYAGGYASGAGR
jgi:hypothetical protein